MITITMLKINNKRILKKMINFLPVICLLHQILSALRHYRSFQIIINKSNIRKKTIMQQSPRKNNQINNEKEFVFQFPKYRFRGFPSKPHQFMKTSIKRKFTQEELTILTKLFHRNIIGLKKIGKSKKNSEEEVFCLYYENIPYSLEMILNKTQFDVRPETLEAALTDIKNYLLTLGVSPDFSETNIGVNQNGVIKAYISFQNILNPGITLKRNQQCQSKIKYIKTWYSSTYSRRSLKPSQIPRTISDKRLSQAKLKKITQIKCDMQKLRKNIRSEQSKNNSILGFTGQQDRKLKLITNAEPNSNFTINIYNQHSNPPKKNVEVSVNQRKQQLNKKMNYIFDQQVYSPQPQVHKYNYDYDDESVDTYRMQLGEDFEMPSIRTNQKLRQTVLNNKKSWDTLTYKSPNNSNSKKNVYESAGKRDFSNIVQNNRRLLKQSQGKNEIISDNKTVQQNHVKAKNWQSSTIKSTLPPNIQDRVQQALTKTKNVMQMLKNTKSVGK